MLFGFGNASINLDVSTHTCFFFEKFAATDFFLHSTFLLESIESIQLKNEKAAVRNVAILMQYRDCTFLFIFSIVYRIGL